MNAARPEASSAARTERLLKEFHEEGALGRAYDAGMLLRLWPFVRPYRSLLGLSLAVILVTASGALARPLLMRWVVDDGVLGGEPGLLLTGGAAFAAILVLEQVLGFVQIYAVQIVGARSMADLRRHIFSLLHQLPVRFFDRQPVGRLVTRVTNDVDAVLELFASGALNAFGDMTRLIGIVVLMLVLDYKLALIAFAGLPPVSLMVLWVRRRMREVFREIRAKTARMNAAMNEQVTGMSVIQAYGRQAQQSAEFDEINAAYRDANMKSIKYEAIQDAAIEAVSAIGLASLVMALGYRGASFGTLVAFSAYLQQFFEPIGMLAQRYTLLQSAMAGAERVFGLLDVGERDAPGGDAGTPGSPEWMLELDDVHFGYKPGVTVLDGVSLAIRPGEKVAVVGPTGSGKTTILALLQRFYEVEQGCVRVRGRDVRSYERSELRRLFAVVPQDVLLFPGTLAENVAAGGDVDLARVERVLRRLGAWDLLCNRPGGINTAVDENGANFSAGERQLIAFSRALYRDTPVVILDEATANVDSATEAKIQRALEELLQDRTALVVAHRLSTIRRADRIVVMQRGRIAEQGSHDQLLVQDGLYAALHRLHQATHLKSAHAVDVDAASSASGFS